MAARSRSTRKADDRAPRYSSMKIGQEYGVTGFNRSGGYIYEDFEKLLQGIDGRKRLREMAFSHPVIAAGVFGYRQMLVTPKIWVEPASEKANDVAAAEHVEQCLDDMDQSFDQVRNEWCTYLTYGFSLLETIYKRRQGKQPNMYISQGDNSGWVASSKPSSRYDDGRIGWHKMSPRNQETIARWEFADNSDLVGAWQSAPPNYANLFLPMEKCMHFTTNVMQSNPEGTSILRPAWRQYRLSMRVEDAEAIGVARNLHGYPVLTAPEGIDLFDASDPDMAALLDDCKKLVTNIKRDEQQGAVLPFGWVLQLLSAGGTGSGINTNEIIDRYHARIAMSMLVQFLLLGMERGGAYELAKQQQGLWLRAVRGYLKADLSVMNEYAIPRLIDLNDFGEITGYPKLVAEDITEPEITAIADYASKLGQQGFFTPSPETEKHLRERAGFPELEEEYAINPMLEEPEEPGKTLAATGEAEDDIGSGAKQAQKFDDKHHYSINDVLEKEHTHKHPNVRDLIENELDHGPEE